jgi:hypothetical protein
MTHQCMLVLYRQFRATSGRSKPAHLLVPVLARMRALTFPAAPAADARNRNDRHGPEHGPSQYQRLESYLRANAENFRLALLRTYLPRNGRRALPLPTIQQAIGD